MRQDRSMAGEDIALVLRDQRARAMAALLLTHARLIVMMGEILRRA